MAGALAGPAPASEEDMLAGAGPASAPDTRRLSEAERGHSPFPFSEKENVPFLLRTAQEASTGLRCNNRGRFRAVLMHREAAIRESLRAANCSRIAKFSIADVRDTTPSIRANRDAARRRTSTGGGNLVAVRRRERLESTRLRPVQEAINSLPKRDGRLVRASVLRVGLKCEGGSHRRSERVYQRYRRGVITAAIGGVGRASKFRAIAEPRLPNECR